jgi:hypothetical protein
MVGEDATAMMERMKIVASRSLIDGGNGYVDVINSPRCVPMPESIAFRNYLIYRVMIREWVQLYDCIL